MGGTFLTDFVLSRSCVLQSKDFWNAKSSGLKIQDLISKLLFCVFKLFSETQKSRLTPS